MSLTPAPVHLVPYNPSWPQLFLAERTSLEEALGPWLDGEIEHVGSTAVPGLRAKPIIDIMAGVTDRKDARGAFGALAQLGYLHAPYKQEIMDWFCKPSVTERTHHLYLIERDHPEWAARIAFRDYLRKHLDTARSYEKLKLQLAQRFTADREAYTRAKGEFVSSVVKVALQSGDGSQAVNDP